MASEARHQQAVIKWSQQPSIRAQWPELALLHHIKNETRGGAAQVAGGRCVTDVGQQSGFWSGI